MMSLFSCLKPGKRLWLQRCLALWLSGLLLGCSVLPSTPPALPELPLLAPAALQQQWQVTQTVTVEPLQPLSQAPTDETIPAKSMPPLLAVWSVTDQRVDLAGLTLSGQTLLTLSYQGQQGQLREQASALLPPGISGRDILSQIQLAYWPLSALQTALRTSPWRLEAISSPGKPQERHLYLPSLGQPWDNSQPVLSLYHWPNDEQRPGRVVIIHHLQQWRLQIETLSVEELSNQVPPP